MFSLALELLGTQRFTILAVIISTYPIFPPRLKSLALADYLKRSPLPPLLWSDWSPPPPHPPHLERKPGSRWSLTLYSTFGVDGTEHLLFSAQPSKTTNL